MTDTTSPKPLSARAQEILAEATSFDGTPPVSDQAQLAVAQGRRKLLELPHAVGIIGEGEVDLVVRPAQRGQGIGRSTLEALLSDESAQSRPAELRAWAHGENPAATALLRAAGFAPVRELLRLALDPARLVAGIEHARPMPAGFDVFPFDPSNSARADDWVRVNARAFASHPEQGGVTRADFDTLTREPWFIAEDLRLAYRVAPGGAGTGAGTGSGTGELAGFTWVKTVREGGSTETELYVLGVDPAFAGIGLGAALLGETLRRMQLHEPDRITLYVDGDNTHAVELYLRAGFEVEQRSVQYLRSNGR